jgi:hypothetical protein
VRTNAALAWGRPALQKLIADALQSGPWNVIFERPAGFKVDAGRMAMSAKVPYWWPDPKNPNGPYINRDGHWTPDRFTA